MPVTRSRARLREENGLTWNMPGNLNNHVSLHPSKSLCSTPSLSIPSQPSHIPYTRNPNISERSCHCRCCCRSSPNTRLSQACLVGTEIQYLQAWKATTGPSSSTHRVGRLQARSGRALQSHEQVHAVQQRPSWRAVPKSSHAWFVTWAEVVGCLTDPVVAERVTSKGDTM
jgi:hypothetical protein